MLPVDAAIDTASTPDSVADVPPSVDTTPVETGEVQDADDADGADGDTAVTPSACDETHPDHTVGLLSCAPAAYAGYTLFAPLAAKTVYLIDMAGRVVHTWDTGYSPGNVVKLLEDGRLLFTGDYSPDENPRLHGGGQGGLVRLLDWDGAVLWSYAYSTATHRQHHDVAWLPSGNVLLVAWEFKSKTEVAAAGRDPATGTNAMWPDTIVEVAPSGASSGDIVWEWHAWDHLIQDSDSQKANYGVIAEHPERIDLNADGPHTPDWNHVNAVAYNADLDQIMISVHEFSEVWIIDHSTTTTEAAGHTGGNRGRGGDLLYRWGNPKNHHAGAAEDQQLFGQHDAHWIPEGLSGAGHVLVFDNGRGRTGDKFSRIVELATGVQPDGSYALVGGAYPPTAPIWEYVADPPTRFYSSYISGAQRLPNGNTLICSGESGRLFEVTSAGTLVWEYINPVFANGPHPQGEPLPTEAGKSTNNVFRAYRFGADFPGLAGRVLTPGAPIELPAGE